MPLHVCPQAFIKLESMPSIPSDKKEAFSDLAMSIFLKSPPADPKALRETREKRSNSGKPQGGLVGMDELLHDLAASREQVGGVFRRIC